MNIATGQQRGKHVVKINKLGISTSRVFQLSTREQDTPPQMLKI